MTPLVFVLTALAGGAGAACRFMLDRLIGARGGFPLGTVVINVTGSFALGLLAGASIALNAPTCVPTVLGVGLLGGYTTFSTASADTVALLRRSRWALAVLSAFGTLAISVGAAALGIALGLLV